MERVCFFEEKNHAAVKRHTHWDGGFENGPAELSDRGFDFLSVLSRGVYP